MKLATFYISISILFSGIPLSAQPTPNTIYYLISQISTLHADVRGGSQTSGTEIWQYTPNCSPAQQWKFVSADGGYYYIESKVSGLNMDVRLRGRGSCVHIFSA